MRAVRQPSIRNKREGFEHTNFECALLILADADRYGGDKALAVQWARAVLGRQAVKREAA